MADISSNKLNILFLGKFNCNENLSGPEKYTKRVFEYFEKSENSIFIEYFDDGKKYTVFQKLFGKEKVFDGRNIYRMGLFPILLHVGTTSYDIIHLLSFERFAQLVYVFFSRKPYIYTIHGIIEKEDAAKQNVSALYKLKNGIAENQFFSKSKKGLIFSNHLLSELPNFFDKVPSSIKLGFLGIDDLFLQGTSKANNSGQPLEVLFLGGFHDREKCAENLIIYLSSQNIDVTITCVGFEQAFKIPSQSQISLKFVPKGTAIAWKEMLQKSDIFISPYKGETFSIASLEAMAMGNIVIADKDSGVARFIIHGENAFSVDIESYTGIVDIITNIKENFTLRNAIEYNAMLSVKKLTWDAVGREHKMEYLKMISAGRESD